MKTAARLSSLLLALLSSACSPARPHANPVATALATAPLRVAVVSGDSQEAPVNTPLAYPVVLEVTDIYGAPAPGVEVVIIFPFRGTGDRVVTTGADGRASVLLAPLELGPCLVGAQVWRAQVSNLATFTVRGL